MNLTQHLINLEFLIGALSARIDALEKSLDRQPKPTSLELERAELEIMEREARRVIRPLYERSVPGVVTLSRSE
jgi:hypothetical protein